MKYGLLRETEELAQKDGIDKDTGTPRTGLETYLAVIYPDINDWVHNKGIPKEISGGSCRTRPDYRSEKLKIIIEFNGLQNYNNPEKIIDDENKCHMYERLGYKVVSIPYFIQLTNEAVKQLFGVDCVEPLFDGSIPSLGVKEKNSPAYLCYKGLLRMAREFRDFPEQYETNIRYLKEHDPENFTDWKILEKLYYDM